MIWIVIHEWMMGANLRNLAAKIECSQNEAIGLLVRLYTWGIQNADSEGKIETVTKEDVADILNIGIDRRYLPETAVEALIDAGYMDFRGDCLYIHDWGESQKYWYRMLKTHAADNERKAREREKKKASKSQKSQSDISSRISPIKDDSSDFQGGEVNNTPSKPVKKSKNEEKMTGFEEFWSAYPKERRVGKAEARKKYQDRLNDGWSPAELIEAARNYASETAARHTEPRYIKHPKTFLSENTPFADYIKKRGGANANNYNDYNDAGNADDGNPFSEFL